MRKINESMPPVVLVGTKSDLGMSVDADTVNAMARRIGAYQNKFYPCSAMAGTGVEEIFLDAIRASLSGGGGAGGGCCNVQ